MYGTMRLRAPHSTPPANKIAGIVTTGIITLVAGYGLANGLSKQFIETFVEPMTVATLPDETPPPEAPPENLSTAVDAPTAPPVVIDLPEFRRATDDTIIIAPPPERPPLPPGAGTAPPRAPVQAMPRLIARDKPAYPAIAIRNEWTGLTGIRVCVDARGRVTEQSLASSSGHKVLDDAALDWVRSSKFKPGTLDGAPAAMCGASVIYEWKITR